MIGIFKQKTPVNIFLLLLFGILIKLPMFQHPYIPSVQDSDSILYAAILKYLKPYGESSHWLYPLIAIIFLFTQAVMLSRIINNRRMTSTQGYLPGMSYLLITSLFPEWNYFSAPLLCNTLFLFIFSGLFKVYNLQSSKGMLYNTGLALGIAGFLFVPSFGFIIWIFLALGIIKPFRLNEWLIGIVGITTPFYFYGIYLFLTDQWNWQNFFPKFSIGIPDVKQSIWLAASAALIVIPFLMWGYYVQDSLRRMLIQVRKGWSLFLLFLLVAILVPFVNPADSFETWVLTVIPLAAFHSCTYLYATYRIIPLLLFWITVAFILFYQYYTPGW